jgi:hypothetical protein
MFKKRKPHQKRKMSFSKTASKVNKKNYPRTQRGGIRL